MKTGKQLGNEPVCAISETNSAHQSIDLGITKREYFAGLAMQGLLSDPDVFVFNKCAKQAVECADSLLEELAK